MRDVGAWRTSSSIAASSIARSKIAFLQSLDVLSVPATYAEPKGIFLLEAMATGVPVVQPRRGAFPEIIETNGRRAARRRGRCRGAGRGAADALARSRAGAPRSARRAPPACESTTPSAGWPKKRSRSTEA